ncbi:type II toxin-antitoxin system RelE/ParE family toxin [Novosphingobium sp. KACC 22771]|uniref:type II toxin-antitoxin system RelE/ParE family toxin n=1 Tax=Novosphingobium sp. KACC 22771 TaxID=3025670 RepID=UPI002366012C|nr:type II toxin-antitoxin system RelE/ParE family toxin [Novosphingobium sp. KACC 22771]WDF74504.1 type II toxin-antitoxin system RelE/ParE family toxin [Novosphingobium sp. KACC 22771]
MTYDVVFAPEAEARLIALYRYIAQEASPDIAESYTSAIVEFCEGLQAFPHRGTPRDDIRPGLRTIPFRRRVTIAYAVGDSRVSIVGLHYGGQDISAAWMDEPGQ